MIRTIIVSGLIAGAVAGVWVFFATVAPVGRHLGIWGAVGGYLSMLIGFISIFAAIRRERTRRPEARIGFWPALGMGLAITVIAGALYTQSWEAALAVTRMDFAGDYGRAMISQAQSRGAGPAEMAKVMAQAQALRAAYADPVQRELMTFMEIAPVGVLVSLIAAVLGRGRSPQRA